MCVVGAAAGAGEAQAGVSAEDSRRNSRTDAPRIGSIHYSRPAMAGASAVLFPLAGGALIGLATALLLLLDGRIAGVSGILGGTLQRSEPGEWTWRALFLLGLVTGGVVARLVAPQVLGSAAASLPTLVIAGLLVGFGTRLSGGCTSGHGVCGIARFSKRSIVATGTFMAVAAAVVLVVRHAGAR